MLPPLPLTIWDQGQGYITQYAMRGRLAHSRSLLRNKIRKRITQGRRPNGHLDTKALGSAVIFASGSLTI